MALISIDYGASSGATLPLREEKLTVSCNFAYSSTVTATYTYSSLSEVKGIKSISNNASSLNNVHITGFTISGNVITATVYESAGKTSTYGVTITAIGV